MVRMDRLDQLDSASDFIRRDVVGLDNRAAHKVYRQLGEALLELHSLISFNLFMDDARAAHEKYLTIGHGSSKSRQRSR